MATPQYIKDAQNAYNAKFDLVQLKLPKGTKERIKAALEGRQSIAGYCVESVLDALERLESDKSKKEKVCLSGADKSPVQIAHKTEIEPKTSQERKSTKEQEKAEIKTNKTPDDLQAMLDAKKAEIKERKEKELAEDRAKFEQFEEDKLKAMLNDEEFRSCVSNPMYKADFIQNYGICNYERVQKCLQEIEGMEKEAAREVTISRANCPF